LKTRVDARFREEATRFAFRFVCEDCVHFHARSERCSLGYPAAPRRPEVQPQAGRQPEGQIRPDPLPDAGTELALCKAFELM
jgi:hypothetical protein